MPLDAATPGPLMDTAGYGIAAATIHRRDPVTRYHPAGYYRRAVGTDPIVGYASHCAGTGEPITLTSSKPKE